MKLQLIIPGTPQPKQSVRSTITTDKVGRLKIRHHQTEKVQANEKAISLQARVQLPKGFAAFTGPVAVTKLHYYFKPQKHWPKYKLEELKAGKIFYKNTKPDVTDNLAKPLFDALEGLIFINDSQICKMDNVAKMYGLEPRIEIEFEEL